MNARDKDKIKVLINEAKVWCDTNEEIATVLDDDCEEIPFHCLEIKTVKMLLDQLKEKLLKDDITDEVETNSNHLRECPSCHSKNVEAIVEPGSWGYYPASAYIECHDCGLRSREYDGKDDCDKEGAILKATVAWNRRH